MKAIVITKYGSADGLQLQEIEKPVPGAHDVLVKVHAGTVTRGDVMLRKLKFPMSLALRVFGVRQKRTPGHEFAGEIESVGQAVSRFKPGDQVFGTTTGLTVGANAEYVRLPEAWAQGVLAIKPANKSYDEAAAVPVGGMTALYLLKKGKIQSGHKVLIHGASGSVGSFAVQLAKHFGADVTGVSGTANVELVKALGADTVIDYTQQDFATTGQTYDLIFDAVGKTSLAHSKSALGTNGVFVSVKSVTREQTDSLLFLKELMEAGELCPMIDRRYRLEQTAEAHRYVESGRKKGNVVIAIA